MQWRCGIWLSVFCSTWLQAAPVRLVTEIFPPYQQQSADAALHGWSVDIVRQILQAAQLTYSIDVMPWARAYKTASSQPDTLIFSLLRTEEREEQFAWIAPLCPMRISFYTGANRTDVQAADIQSALKYVVGVENGQANYRFLREQGFRESRNLVVVGHNHQLQQMLELGRIDLMLVSDNYVQQLPNRGAQLRRVFTAHALERYLFLAAHPATDPVLLQKLRQAWQQVKSQQIPACQQVSSPPF
ncbi:MAG: transporter substrate-binding domain-containing protein [Rheinheimera sp.]|nr:transporter substrate-binding domain-containing protein [Rheinheimera sp.]